MKSVKAQVSVETIVAIIILLLTFTLVLVHNNNFQTRIDYLNSTELQKTDCSKMVSAINLVQSTSENSFLELTLSFDANISGNFIEMQDYYCEFHGLSSNAVLSKGTIVIRKENGVLYIENK